MCLPTILRICTTHSFRQPDILLESEIFLPPLQGYRRSCHSAAGAVIKHESSAELVWPGRLEAKKTWHVSTLVVCNSSVGRFQPKADTPIRQRPQRMGLVGELAVTPPLRIPQNLASPRGILGSMRQTKVEEGQTKYRT